jgi:lipopolysaccharide export system protein LptA
MKSKKILTVVLMIFLLITLVYIIAGLKGKTGVDYKVESRPDGEGIRFLTYNKENKKALEIKCAEYQQQTQDRTLMKDIEALIFKKGKMNSDVSVHGDEGYVENNKHDFFIEKNARLISEDYVILSKYFTLKDRAEMRSSPKVTYRTKALKGTAEGGLALYLKINTLKLYDTSGTYKRKNRTFDYKTNVLWVMEPQHMVVMEKDSEIRDQQSILRSDWITVKLTEDLKQIVQATSQKNSYLYAEDREKHEVKEIKSEVIDSFYDEDGNVTKILVIKGAQILLKSGTGRTLLISDSVEMNFDGPSGKLKNMKIPRRSRVENTGENQFQVIADTSVVKYDEAGEIRYCEGSGNVKFVVEKYRGGTANIHYSLEKKSMTLEGEDSEIISNRNTFRSALFSVDTQNKILTTNKGIKSIIRLDEEKENVLLSKEAVYINSQTFTIYEKENKLSYGGGVNLNQRDIVLDAMKLEIDEENGIIARGNVSLTFKSGEKEIGIKGGEVIFNSKEKRIEINENAIIKSDVNLLRAAGIVVFFNEKNEPERITGEKNINFTKDDLSGYSDGVNWLFKEEVMVLMGSPYIVKQSIAGDGGRTEGRELKIDLKTNKITILSSGSRRTETVIK